jgi:hypothetical protein
MVQSFLDAKTVEREPQVPPALKTAPERALRTCIGESAEAYPRVVAVLDAKTRVIECAAGLQWIVQRRTGSPARPWTGRSFCRTDALLRCASYWVTEILALKALPDRFVEDA